MSFAKTLSVCSASSGRPTLGRPRRSPRFVRSWTRCSRPSSNQAFRPRRCTETSRCATCFARRAVLSGTTSRTPFEGRSTGMSPATSAVSGSTEQASAPFGRCSTPTAGTMSRSWRPFSPLKTFMTRSGGCMTGSGVVCGAPRPLDSGSASHLLSTVVSPEFQREHQNLLCVDFLRPKPHRPATNAAGVTYGADHRFVTANHKNRNPAGRSARAPRHRRPVARAVPAREPTRGARSVRGQITSRERLSARPRRGFGRRSRPAAGCRWAR